MSTGQNKESIDDWNFPYPKNLAVITTKRVLRREAPVLHVYHDDDASGWQFLDDGEIDIHNASVVGLYTMTQIDATLSDLADLPSGWEAWRPSLEAPWQRRAGL